jgi:hypothetical protein
MIVSGEPVRIGAVDDPDYAFSAVSELAVGPDGSVYTTHFQEAQVRRWTPDGLPAGTVGREGEGPGEFVSPRTLGFFGDSLWVMDFRTYRASFFSAATGEFLGSSSPRVDLGGAADPQQSPPRPNQPLRDGSWYARTPGWSDAIARGELTRGQHQRVDESGAPTATVWVQEWSKTDIWALLDEEGGGAFMPQPFGDEPLLHVYEDGGMLIVDRRAYDGEGVAVFRLTRVSTTGDTLSRIAVPFEPQALPRAYADSTLDAQATSMHEFRERFRPGSSSLGATRQGLAETFYRPRYLPAVKAAVVARNGDVWLRRHLLEPDRSGWWVFDPEGSMRATADLPAELTVKAVAGDRVWGVETDHLDVPYIVGYRLVRSEN